MTTIELKYELFKDIDSIDDENVLKKIALYVRKYSNMSKQTRSFLYDEEMDCFVNDKTVAAVEESSKGIYAGEVDSSSFEAFEKSLGL